MVRILDAIIEQAALSNWGNRKSSDKAHIIGYLNFKCKVRIDGKLHFLRIAVQFCRNGKLYYNHEVNKW